METTIHLWDLTKPIKIKTQLNESITKLTSIKNHIYLQTASHRLLHGTIDHTHENIPFVELVEFGLKVLDIDSCQQHVYLATIDGCTYKYDESLTERVEIALTEEYKCPRGHTAAPCSHRVASLAVAAYGQLFITDAGQLWASGRMPQVQIEGEAPRRVAFFAGRFVHAAHVGRDFAIAIVSKPSAPAAGDGDEEVFAAECAQCRSASQLTSPGSASELCPLGVKLQTSYDIETTSTSSKNDSSSSSKLNFDLVDVKEEKNIIFRNTEAARDFLTRQISRMSSVGEEFVECTEKPTRILKENMTNVASFVYEGVKTLSRHVSGSSDCCELEDAQFRSISRIASRECVCSLSQCTSEKDFSEGDLRDRLEIIVRSGANLINCEVWTWGNIIHGQLGIGDKIKRERPMIITKLSNIGVRKVSVQNFHASVLTLDGRAYIWGRNDHNQVTLDSISDQSSPKLYNHSKDDRVKDIVSGEDYTALLTNNLNLLYFGKEATKTVDLHVNHGSNQSENRIELFRNLLNSVRFTVFNVNNFVDNFFVNFLLDEQTFLEEMLNVQLWVIKPLLKKSMNSLNPSLFEELCTNYTNLLYFWSANVQSLLEHSNGLVSLCDIIVFKYLEEFIFVYRSYICTIFNLVCVDGFGQIGKLIEISPNLYKARFTRKEKTDEQIVSTYLLAPLDKIAAYTATIQNYMKQATDQRHCDITAKWAEFVDETESRRAQADQTKEFWLQSGRIVDFLREPGRRLVRDSNKSPIQLQNAGRFSSHRFVLLSDLFVHVNGSTPTVHALEMIWLEPQQDENERQHQICLRMPEEALVLCTNEPEGRNEWFFALQGAIRGALGRGEATQLPAMRNGSFTFGKSGFFREATYTGRWLNGKMHGVGKVQWSDGKVYSGQFANNQIAGHGIMAIPNFGTYEGFWKDNQQNGYGTLTYINTDVYRGYFKDGQLHGHGSFRKGSFMANTASYFIGDWINGMKNGYGVMDDIVAGEKYIGGWLDDKKHGEGLIITSDGIFYEGYFFQDTLTGQGLMILDDGTRYEGEFRGTGVLNGKGTLTLPTGHRIEGNLIGTWNEGIKITNGVLNKCEEEKSVIKRNSFESDLNLNNKWRALFKQCHLVIGVPETNGKNGRNSDTSKIWQNVAVYLNNASETLKRTKSDRNYQNSLNKLDIIPPFGRDKLDFDGLIEVKSYLSKAFESNCHPLGSLLNNLSEAYTTTYEGRAHPLLLNHAISELHYICKRLYNIVRVLFPALPPYDKESLVENDEKEEIVNYQSLLYPLILPKVHHPLFNLFTLKNEKMERQYKRRLFDWNKKSDNQLMHALSVEQKFIKMGKEGASMHRMFEEAIESLQQLKSTFSPSEKLIVLRETVEKMTPVAQGLLGNNYHWNMDDLFPNFLFVVVRARIPELGSELDFIDSFMDPSLESGELGILYITLKACYQQIFNEKNY